MKKKTILIEYKEGYIVIEGKEKKNFFYAV